MLCCAWAARIASVAVGAYLFAALHRCWAAKQAKQQAGASGRHCAETVSACTAQPSSCLLLDTAVLRLLLPAGHVVLLPACLPWCAGLRSLLCRLGSVMTGYKCCRQMRAC